MLEHSPSQEFEFGVKYPARVIYVYDGDTVKVDVGGRAIVIRLLGVDTPEKTPGKNRPYEYDAIEFDEVAGLKGYYGRYLAYVYLEDGTDFNVLLVKKGYARVSKLIPAAALRFFYKDRNIR